MKKNIIIVAGGKGLRVGGELPKQFLVLGEKPILMHTLNLFYNYNKEINIVLVLPKSHQDYWTEICKEYKFDIPHQIATGGKTRYHSVKNGLVLVDEGIVGVHDGVRAFASKAMIARCFDAALLYKAVVPVVDATDSLRQVESDGLSKIIDRSKIKLVQTPQVFSVDLLKKAYEGEFKESYTDDASVVESYGQDVHLLDGEVENMKVTTPIDLKIGELLINR